jgi:DNA polymerase epsilon subunit 2
MLGGPISEIHIKVCVHIFCIRYAIIHQRTQRHELFTPAILGTDSEDAGRKFKLQPIEFLLSSSGRVKEAIVLGLLTQLREGRYYVEDPTGILQLDLSETISFITVNTVAWYKTHHHWTYP